MFCLADNDTTILHNVLGLDKYIATVHMLDFSLLVLVEGGKDDKILRAWDGGKMCIFIPDICKPFIVTRKKNHKKKRDVGMVCQKVHKQGRIKVMVNIQSLIHPYIFAQKSKLRCRNWALYIYHHFYPSLFVCFLACHSYISFHF